MKMSTIIASLFLGGHLLTTQAQEDRVEIPNYRDPELKSYTQMLKGLEAYQDKHEHAPDSELYFILIPKTRKYSLQDLTMRLASDDVSIPVPIDPSGVFKLPLIEQDHDGEYDLILNKPKGQFLIRPYVKSARLPDDTRRLGDLRLECEVRWAIERQEVSAIFRTYVNMLSSGDPCTSRFVNVRFYAPQGVESITLDAAGSRTSQKVRSYEAYSLPLWNAALSDDSVIKYERAAPVADAHTAD